MPIWEYIQNSSSPHIVEDWGLFYLHVFGLCVFSPSRFWAPGHFSHHHSSTIGALSNGWKFLCVVVALLGLLCVLSLTWAAVSSFSSGWGICFCNDLWLGLFPHDFCYISPSSSKMGFVLVMPSILRKRPRSLGFF